MKAYSKLKKTAFMSLSIKYFILEEHVKAQNIEIIISLCPYATAT